MPRLFSALVPPQPAVDHLSDRLDRVPGLRWTPTDGWHVTLGFYGDTDDPEYRSGWLRGRLAGLAAPRVRLAGAGRFPGVLWIGLSAVDDEAGGRLAAVGHAARIGDDEHDFRPHLTVGRSPKGRGGRLLGDLARAMADYTGPKWTAEEVLLFASQLGARGARYTVVDRFPLS